MIRYTSNQIAGNTAVFALITACLAVTLHPGSMDFGAHALATAAAALLTLGIAARWAVVNRREQSKRRKRPDLLYRALMKKVSTKS